MQGRGSNIRALSRDRIPGSVLSEFPEFQSFGGVGGARNISGKRWPGKVSVDQALQEGTPPAAVGTRCQTSGLPESKGRKPWSTRCGIALRTALARTEVWDYPIARNTFVKELLRRHRVQ